MKYRSAIIGAVAGLFLGIGNAAYILANAAESPGRSGYVLLLLMVIILSATGALAGIGIRRILALAFPKK